jgi:N-acyl-L-homoserine lactone synthetase
MEVQMIRIEYARALAGEAHILDQLFRMRARVFRERLNWDVVVTEGRERDLYDDLNPLYVLSMDERSGDVRGAVRILPTTSRHMMEDIFHQYFDEQVVVRSPNVWECTRFCIHPEHEKVVTPTGLNVATCELLYGVCSVALESGIEQLLGVSELPMLRIYRRSGWAPEIIGSSRRPGSVPIFAGLWDVNAATCRTIAARAGLCLGLGDVQTDRVAA